MHSAHQASVEILFEDGTELADSTTRVSESHAEIQTIFFYLSSNNENNGTVCLQGHSFLHPEGNYNRVTDDTSASAQLSSR